MKLLFEAEDQTLTPFLDEGKIDIDAFFDECNKAGNCETMVALAMNLSFGFARCKDYARQTFNRYENKLVYSEQGKEYRIYDGFLLKPNSKGVAHYGIRVIGDVQLHTAILRLPDDKIEVSVVIVDGDSFKVLYCASIDAPKGGVPIAVAVLPVLSFTYNGSQISLSPLEIYTQDNKVAMLSIAGRQIINIQTAPENSTNQLDKLISLLPTI